jgi:predicted SAM-dependent methyltransferase
MYDKKYSTRNYKSLPINNLSKYSIVSTEIDCIIRVNQKNRLNICEIDCGDGRQLRSIAKAYPNIHFTGIDLLVNPEINHNVNFFKGNLLEKLDDIFEDGSIDLVYGIDVIEHLSRDELYELAKILKKKMAKGGTFLARVPNLDSQSGRENQFGDLTHKTAFNQHSARQFMDILDLVNQEILADAGFVKIFHKHKIKKLTHFSTKIFLKYSSNIYLKGISV